MFRNITNKEDMCKNCAKCSKGFKIGTNQAYNIKIKIRVGGILKIFYLCLYTNMASCRHFCEIQNAITQWGSPRSTSHNCIDRLHISAGLHSQTTISQ